MEAVRMPMTAFDFKAAADPSYYFNGLDFKATSEPTTFTKPLLDYITKHYGESAKSYQKAIEELESLRKSAVEASRDFVGCATLKKYYAQLHLIQSRFPMKEGEPAAVLFAWDDPFSGNAYEAMDIRFEQCCVLYNIGALHSALGTMETRQSSDGMKISCTHFQCGAWAFQQLAKGFDCSSWSPDMNAFVMDFMSTLMLAQAQECILEKSMLDQRKGTIIAKVAAQIVDYYDNQLTKALETDVVTKTLGSKKVKEYKRLITVKTPFYKSIAHFFQGNQSQEQQKNGEAVAHFQLAADSLAEAVKAATKGGSLKESPSLAEALAFASDVVGGKVTSAKKDNDFIYHDRIPEASSLPEIKGAALVKPIPFDPSDPEISGPDIFAQLVPMKVHEAASLYSEEVAKLLRQVGGEIEEKNSELDEFLVNLDLEAVRTVEEKEKVPQDLLERCASMSVREKPVEQLVGKMKTLSGLSCDVKEHLESLRELVETFPPDAPGAGGAADVESEMKHYVEAHARADASNLELNRAMQAHLGNLKLLAGNLDSLVADLPKLDAEKMKEDPAVAEMLRLAGKLEYMKASRGELERELREKLNKRDVTKELVILTGEKEKPDPEELEAFFKKVLNDYDKDVEILRQNLSAQVNVLNAVTDANAAYTAIRKQMMEKQQRRDAMIKSLIKSYDMYEDLATKSQKGIEFYQKLLSNINKLLEKLNKRLPKAKAETTPVSIPMATPTERPSPAPSNHESDYPINDVTTVKGDESLPQSTLSAPLPDTGMDAASMMSMLAAEGVAPGGGGLKLKDLLPYMKPERFGASKGRQSPAKSVNPPLQHVHDGELPPGHQPMNEVFPRPPSYEVAHMYPPMIPPTRDVGPSDVAPMSTSVGHPSVSNPMTNLNPPILSAPSGAMVTRLSNFADQSVMPAHRHTSQITGGQQWNGGPYVSQQQPFVNPPLPPYQLPHSVSQPVPQSSLPQYPIYSTSQPPSQPNLPILHPVPQQNHSASQQPPHPISQQLPQPTSEQPPISAAKQPPHSAPQQPPHSAPQQPIPSVPQQPQPAASQQPPQPAPHQPLQPAPQQLPQPATQQPPQPSSQLPPQPAPQQPLHSAPQQPPQLAPQQPLHSVPQKPVHSAPQHPPHPAAQQPSHAATQPSYPIPQQPPHILPQQSLPHQPSQTDFPQPPQLNHQPTPHSIPQPPHTVSHFLPHSVPQQSPNSMSQNPPPSVPQHPLFTVPHQPFSTPQQPPASQPPVVSGTQPTLTQYQPNTNQRYPTTVPSNIHPQSVSKTDPTQSVTQQYQHVIPNPHPPAPQGQQPYPQQPSNAAYLKPQSVLQAGPVVPIQGAHQNLGQVTSNPQGSQQHPQLISSSHAQPSQHTGARLPNPAQFVSHQQSRREPVQPPAHENPPCPIRPSVPQSSFQRLPGPLPNLQQQTMPHIFPPNPHATNTSSLTYNSYSNPSTYSQAGSSDALGALRQAMAALGGPSTAIQQPQQAMPHQQQQQNYPHQASSHTSSGNLNVNNNNSVPPGTTPFQSSMTPGQTAYGYQLQQPSYQQMQRSQGYQQQYPGQTPSQPPHSYQPQPHPQNEQLHPQPLQNHVSVHSGLNPTPVTQSTSLQQTESRPQCDQQQQQPGVTGSYPNEALSRAPSGTPKESASQSLTPLPTQSNWARCDAVAQPSNSTSSHARKGSLDDILSLSGISGDVAAQKGSVCDVSSGSGDGGGVEAGETGASAVAPVLSPKVITSEEQIRLREEKRFSQLQDCIPTAYVAASDLKGLEKEARAFKEKVDNLTVYGADGWMRDVWSYVSKASSEAVAGKTKAVAKLASTKKNRGVRSLPFDENRVVLKWKELSTGANQGVGRGEGDDYINASTVSELCVSSTRLIATQLPTSASLSDFLALVVQERVSLVLTIASGSLFDQTQQPHQPKFWPGENESKIQIGPFTVCQVATPRERRCRSDSSSSSSSSPTFIERDLSIKIQNKEHLVTQFHMTSWPAVGLPSSPLETLAFLNEINAHFFKLRAKSAPIVVQCLEGSGPSGIVSLIHASILYHLSGAGIPDMAAFCVKANAARSNFIQDKEQLVFCYQALALHLEKYLSTKNIRLSSAANQKTSDSSKSPTPPTASTTPGRPASLVGTSPRSSPKSRLAAGSSASSVATTPSTDELFSQNPVSFGQILSCVSGMTCRTSTAPTPPNHGSPETGKLQTPSTTTTMEPCQGAISMTDCEIIADATKPQPSSLTLVNEEASAVPTASAINGRPGLTLKELTNKEEKEVAEEKDELVEEISIDAVNGVASDNETISVMNQSEGIGETDSKGVVASNLALAMDPSQFTLKEDTDVAPNLKKQKPGINAYLNRNEADTSDPLSSLDPIWNRKGN